MMQLSIQDKNRGRGRGTVQRIDDRTRGQKGHLFPSFQPSLFPPFPLIFIAIFLSFSSSGWGARRRWDEIDKGWPLSRRRRPSEGKKKEILDQAEEKEEEEGGGIVEK